jgi:hypothetical protein
MPRRDWPYEPANHVACRAARFGTDATFGYRDRVYQFKLYFAG